MSRRSLLRRILIWLGPILTILLLVVGGFVYWVATTAPGARWALVTATRTLGGTVSGVSGSVWTGLDVAELHLPLAAADITLTDVHLNAQWADLLHRRLRVHDISAGSLQIDLADTGEPQPESEAFAMPALPIQIDIDRMALGELRMSHDNVPMPVTVDNLVASLHLDGDEGSLTISSVDLGHDSITTHIDGQFRLLDLGEPWPFEADFTAKVLDQGADSVLCADRYLATLPRTLQPEGDPAPDCAVQAVVGVTGSLEDMKVTVRADGQGMDLDATAQLTPTAAFPLRDARIDLTLADESALHVDVDWRQDIAPQNRPNAASEAAPGSDAEVAPDHITGNIRSTRLDIGGLAGDLLPPAVLTSEGHFDLRLRDRTRLIAASVDLAISEGSMWNEQPLAGKIKASIDAGDATPSAPAATPAVGASSAGAAASVAAAPAPFVPDWRTLLVHDVDVDLRLGNNDVRANGGFGAPDSKFGVHADAPRLASFWPGIPGALSLDAEGHGNLANHGLDLKARYTPDNPEVAQLGRAPASVDVGLEGSWGALGPSGDARAHGEGWAGQITRLQADHAGLALGLDSVLPASIAPWAAPGETMWQLGNAGIRLGLEGRTVFELDHAASSGTADGQWKTAGEIPNIAVSQPLVDDIRQLLHLTSGAEGAPAGKDRGGVKVRGALDPAQTQIVLAADWDLAFNQALAGTLSVRRLSGDLIVPADPPFPLGLQTLALDLQARPTSGGRSELSAVLDITTADMGRVDVTARTLLHTTPGGGFALDPKDALTADIHADIDDLGWISLFAGDAMEFGGNLKADVAVKGGMQGDWTSTGTITGSNLRVIRIDDGVRLLDGRLSARLDGDTLLLDELYFPARLRVEPKEWRTAEWVSSNPDARDGYLRATGSWALTDMRGDAEVELYRYPAMQRSDRYAMVSGKVHIAAPLPSLSITGNVTADAGWFDLDMLGGIASVDGDVVVVRAGEEPKEVDVPMDISMDLEVDLGPRFYLTGYGVNSGLVGNMRVVMVDNRLTALGELRTRGGAIEAYGQRLQLRRGTITFQGDITSPILSIEALRTGLAVEAGVRVAGTAKRPRIDLVSYPDVSEIEKLSWLLFGHGPDEGGGDMALLVSVGTSLLGGGEPFYRKFGIDEVSLQSGELGSAGSILPAESVVSGLNSGASDLERQFISVTKGISNNLTIGIRQALSDTGTVGRATYRLARGLTAELSVGTINGLALVYRWFSRD